MSMKLKRDEVVAIYNTIKDVNLLKMKIDCKKSFVINSIKLKEVADKINDENTKVADSLRTKEYDEALQEYLKCKAEYEKENSKENEAALNAAIKVFEPLFQDMEKKFTDIVKSLEQEYEIDLVRIPMDSYLEYLDTLGNDYSFKSLIVLDKLFE